MDNVKDLNPSSRPTQTVSLNELRGSSTNNSVSINAVNGLSGVSEEATTSRPTIKVNPNGRTRLPRRTITQATDVNRINPNDFIKPTQQEESKTMINTIQDNAVSMLDAAVKRKRQEFHDFVESATAADEANRERIKDGLDEINGEINYLPSDLPQSVTKDPHAGQTEEQPVHITKSVDGRLDDEDDYMDDVESDLNSELYGEMSSHEDFDDSHNTHTTINSNPFGFDNDYDEDVEEEEGSYDVDEMDQDNSVDVDYEYENPAEATMDDFDTADPEEEIPFDPIPETESVEESVPEKEEKPVEVQEDEDTITDRLTSGAISVSSKIDFTDSTNIENTTSNDFNLDEEDFDDVTYSGENDEQLSDDEIRNIIQESEKHLKSEILEKVINTSKKLDTTSFRISNKVVSINNAVNAVGAKTKEERYGYWPMMFANRPFKASPLKGPEIALLAEADDSNSENGVGITNQQIRIMYDHDANEYKPKTIEGWAKTIPFFDIESIFGALYVASLKGANYVPSICPKTSCQYSWLNDAGDIKKLVKFTNDNQKKKFEEILKTPITKENTESYESVVNVINDKIAVGIKIPSIFTAVYEYGSLNSEFIRKYTSVISIMQYIDYIYIINPQTASFDPVGWKTYPGDTTKTFKSKIATYSKILKELDDTDFSVLIALINSMVSKMTEQKHLAYEIPATKCPKCGADVAATEIIPRNMVFMRQRLVELATTRTER